MKAKVYEKAKAIELRKDGISITQIAKILDVSKSSVSTWVRNVQLSEEQILLLNSRVGSPSFNREKFAKLRDEYRQMGRENVYKFDSGRYMSGCMLYWAEGRKGRPQAVISNFDSDMMMFFIEFIRDFFDVTNNKISVSLIWHQNNNGITFEDVKKFWLSKLNLPESCLKKSTIKQGSRQKRGTYHQYGGCTLSIYDVRVVQQIWGSLEEFVGIERNEWH